MVKENIHACWSMSPVYDKETGSLITKGLRALGGHGGDGALRELKRRCDAELEYAGKPLVGCGMYAAQVFSLAMKSLDHKSKVKGTQMKVNDAASPGFRNIMLSGLKLLGETEILELIAEMWSKYEEEGTIPKLSIMDLEEEIAEILEKKYCPPDMSSNDFTSNEREASKQIALGLSRQKRRSRTPPPPPKTPEEPEPETPEEPEPETPEEPEPETPEEPDTDNGAMSENDATNMISDKLDRLGRK